MHETPKDPIQWPASVFYLKPIIVLLNVVPLLAFLVLYARLLDRHAANDWAWFLSLFAAAWGSFLFAFDQTLNNHTIAASSAFFALYAFIRIWERGRAVGLGVRGGGLLRGLLRLQRAAGRTVRHAAVRDAPGSVPQADAPLVRPGGGGPAASAFLATQFLAFGQFKPVYEEFGTKSYNYEGSYWNTPLEMDWFNLHPEPYARLPVPHDARATTACSR